MTTSLLQRSPWPARGTQTDPDNGITTYSYGATHKLSSLVNPESQTSSFTYSDDGLLASKTVGTATTKFIYRGTHPIIETDGSGNTTARYDWVPCSGASGVDLSPAAMMRGSACSGSTTNDECRLLDQKRGSTTSWYHCDALGTERNLTNSSETVTDTYSYDAWGNLLTATGTTTNPYRFVGGQGYYKDSESEFHLLTHRYYAAAAGRFLTLDPARDQVNWHQYAGGSPTRLVDPLGLGMGDWMREQYERMRAAWEAAQQAAAAAMAAAIQAMYQAYVNWKCIQCVFGCWAFLLFVPCVVFTGVLCAFICAPGAGAPPVAAVCFRVCWSVATLLLCGVGSSWLCWKWCQSTGACV